MSKLAFHRASRPTNSPMAGWRLQPASTRTLKRAEAAAQRKLKRQELRREALAAAPQTVGCTT